MTGKHDPLFKSRELAAALDIDITEFHELRNGKFPDERIPATSGESTHDQAWDEVDAGRMAMLKAVEHDLSIRSGPSTRAKLYRLLKREVVEKVLRGAEAELLITGWDALFTDDRARLRKFEMSNPVHSKVPARAVVEEAIGKLKRGHFTTQSPEEDD